MRSHSTCIRVIKIPEGCHQILRECRESGTLILCCCRCQIYLNICVWIGICRKLQVANVNLGVWNMTIVAEKMLTTSGSYSSCPRIHITNEERLVPKLRGSKEMKPWSSKSWLLPLKFFSMCMNPETVQEGSSGFTGWGVPICAKSVL